MGIGGIGMSGIAKILKSQGYIVSGCDLECDQKSVQELVELGVPLAKGHDQELCRDESIDILVYSSVIKDDHPELVRAQTRGIPVIKRALMLAEIMRTHFSIAVAGSHGKTTTTSMASHILIEAGKNPTVVIGGVLKNLASNAHWGAGDFLVAEADESDRSLLNLHATIAIITNIDLEHLETYSSLEDIKNTFKQFLNNLPFYGKAILCIDDPIVRSLLPIQHLKTITYGVTPDADLHADQIVLHPTTSECVVFYKGVALGNLVIPVAGRHNLLNALAAVALALDLEIPFSKIAESLATFRGVERRFSYHGISTEGAEIFEDYGHHPKEIFNTLLVARKRCTGKLHVIFQPHRYSRTYHLWQDFVSTFVHSKVDSLTMTDIYAMSEQPIENVTSDRMVIDINSYNPPFEAKFVPLDQELKALEEHVRSISQPGDLVLLLGAGKVNKLASKLIMTV